MCPVDASVAVWLCAVRTLKRWKFFSRVSRVELHDQGQDFWKHLCQPQVPVVPESLGVLLPDDSAPGLPIRSFSCVDSGIAGSSICVNNDNNNSVAILAQDSFINLAPASFWAGLGGVRCACLEQALSFIAKVLAFGVLDTGWRLSTTSCRNSKRPSPSIQVLLVSLAHGVLAALPAAASCRRRLRSRVPAFSLCVCRRRDRVCVVA